MTLIARFYSYHSVLSVTLSFLPIIPYTLYLETMPTDYYAIFRDTIGDYIQYIIVTYLYSRILLSI